MSARPAVGRDAAPARPPELAAWRAALHDWLQLYQRYRQQQAAEPLSAAACAGWRRALARAAAVEAQRWERWCAVERTGQYVAAPAAPVALPLVAAPQKSAPPVAAGGATYLPSAQERNPPMSNAHPAPAAPVAMPAAGPAAAPAGRRGPAHVYTAAEDAQIRALAAACGQVPTHKQSRKLAAELGLSVEQIRYRAVRLGPAAPPAPPAGAAAPEPPVADAGTEAPRVALAVRSAAEAAPTGATTALLAGPGGAESLAGGTGVVLSLVAGGVPYAQLGARSVDDLVRALGQLRGA